MKLPRQMKAAVIERFGPPGVFAIAEVPLPPVGPRDVLIALHAAGVGSWDALIRDGSWAEDDVEFPLVLGTDGAGVVAAVGRRVRRFAVGDRVWAYQYGTRRSGFYAEYVAVDGDHVAPLPRQLDALHGAAGAVTGLTALQGIDDALGVRRGETVLVFGATGAVGTLAVGLAARKRARVIATASGRAAAALVRRLGAEYIIDARHASALDRLGELAPDGLDAVLALAGGDALERCLEHLRRGGRVAYPNGVEPAPRRRRGATLRAYDAAVGRREWERLARAVAEARLTVPIAASYPLVQVARAHARVEKGHLLGRIVLRIRSRGA